MFTPGSVLKGHYVQDILTWVDGTTKVSRKSVKKSTCAAKRPIVANNFMLDYLFATNTGARIMYVLFSDI